MPSTWKPDPPPDIPITAKSPLGEYDKTMNLGSKDDPITLERMETDKALGYFARQGIDRDQLIGQIMRKYRLGLTARAGAEDYANQLMTYSNPETVRQGEATDVPERPGIITKKN